MAELGQEGNGVEIVDGQIGGDGAGEGLEVVVGEEVVVADVGEGGVVVGADEVAEFGIDGSAEEGLALETAEEVLVLLVGLDEGDGEVSGGLEEVGFCEVGAAVLEVAGANGDEMEIFGSSGPLQAVFG